MSILVDENTSLTSQTSSERYDQKSVPLFSFESRFTVYQDIFFIFVRLGRYIALKWFILLSRVHKVIKFNQSAWTVHTLHNHVKKILHIFTVRNK